MLENCSTKALGSLDVSELSQADKDKYMTSIKELRGEQLNVVLLAHKTLSRRGNASDKFIFIQEKNEARKSRAPAEIAFCFIVLEKKVSLPTNW